MDVVFGMARDMCAESSALLDALRVLSSKPSAEQLRSAQVAFARATLAWKQASAFRSGAFVSSNAFQRAAFWPARPGSIDNVLDAKGPIDEPRVEALPVDARGLYALEYLLFDVESARAVALPNDPRGMRARVYALELGTNVHGYASRLQRLLGNGSDYAKSFAAGGKGSVDALVAQAIDTLAIVVGKFDRIERAQRENLPLQFAVEGYFSKSSHQIALSMVNGTRLLYLGARRGGLSDLVTAVSKPIDDHVRAAFQAAEKQLATLDAPLETTLSQRPARFQAAATAVRELRHVLEVEMQSALAG